MSLPVVLTSSALMAVSAESSPNSFADVLYLRQSDLILAYAFCFLGLFSLWTKK